LLSSPAGNDLMFDEDLCKQGGGFINKIWNSFKLINIWEIDKEKEQDETSRIAVEWYTSKFQKELLEIEDHYSKYRISDALMATYKLIWDDYCSWFLEMVKPAYGEAIDQKTYNEVVAILEDNLRILHPFVPFISEEIWQQLKTRTPEEALIVAKWPDFIEADQKITDEFSFASEVISGIRNIRKAKNISFKDQISLDVLNNENTSETFNSVIKKLGNVSTLNYVDKQVEGALSFRVKSNEYFIPIEGAIDVVGERKKLTEELEYTQGFLKSVEKKLSNDRFVSNAPKNVVEIEKAKKSDAEAKIEVLKTSLAGLK